MVEKKSEMDWMYGGTSTIVNPEDYLKGRQIDRNFELFSSEHKAEAASRFDVLSRKRLSSDSERKISALLDLETVRKEDPLVAIKVKEEKAKRELFENPIKMKQLRDLIFSEMQQKMKKALKKSRSKSTSSESSTSEESDSRSTQHRRNERKKQRKSSAITHSSRRRLHSREYSSEHHGKVEHRQHSSHRKSSNNSAVMRSGRRPQDTQCSNDTPEREKRRKSRKTNVSDAHEVVDTFRRKHSADRESRRRRHDSGSSSASPSEYGKVEERRKSRKTSDGHEVVGTSHGKHSADRESRRRRHDSGSSSASSSEHGKIEERRTAENRMAQDNAPKKTYSVATAPQSSTKSEERYRYSDSDSDTEQKRRRNQGYGLIQVKNSDQQQKKPQQVKRSPPPTAKCVKSEPTKSTASSSRNVPKGPISEKEREERLAAMKHNANWHAELVDKKLKYHAAEDQREMMEDKRREKRGSDFIRPMLVEAAAHGTVEGRVKSKRFNVQRGNASMDSNFAKR